MSIEPDYVLLRVMVGVTQSGGMSQYLKDGYWPIQVMGEVIPPRNILGEDITGKFGGDQVYVLMEKRSERAI